ncbi:MAG: D-alanyl-D-alanine carboxypeptidase family protein [Clostridia bacterium]
MRKRKIKRCAAAFMAIIAAITLPMSVQATWLDVSAQGAALLEIQTGKVLYSKNSHQKMPMASTTKVMTAIMAIEHGGLDELVTVSGTAYGVEGSSIYLEKNERINLRDLLYGLMLRSGNDAAVAIAEHIGGSVPEFAELMNQKAVQIGALNTHFVSPNGLHDDEHYTTAYDLALISAYAMRNSIFREIVSCSYHRTTSGNIQRTMQNKNKLLWEYDGATGVKTGYTIAAGKCLVFSAKRDGLDIVGVVLNCPNMFSDARAIMDNAFATYCMERIIKKGDMIVVLPVDSGMRNMLELVADEDIMIPVSRNSDTQIHTKVIADERVYAPVTAGQVLGCVEVWDDTGLLRTVELVAAIDIEGCGYGYYLNKLFTRWTA